MVDSTNPNGGKTTSSNLIPKFFRSDSNKKFLQATVDQLVQPGTVKKVNGYIGKKNARSASGNDIYIEAPTVNRQNFQLEPGLVVKDALENVTFFKDYQDYINQLDVFGGNTTNHTRVNSQEFYSWDPHINWDKFVNFQQYYWLPYGPDVIKVAGQQNKVTSTYKVEIKSEGDNNTYVFYPDGLVENPTIKLYRGQTYRFEINSPGNPFSIKTKRTTGVTDNYVTEGLVGSSVESGVIEFAIPSDAPSVLYYSCDSDVNLGGVFQILAISENTTLNLETDLLGKKTYTLADGTELSNGMKLSFSGKVVPESYSTGQYYVEGVGESIVLIEETILELISAYTQSESILFDSLPFDTMPWSDATAFAGSKDYIVINRRSLDHNPWSRYNRWFHKDVIEASAKYNGKIANIDQTARATRPVIEFDANIKLFNFGTTAIADVDLIDTYTTDVMSNIEGQLGYNIDGIDLAQGQRILFPADTDIRVKNKIYEVNFIYLDGTRRIHLEEQPAIEDNQVALIRQGDKNKGLMYWYDGSTWNKAQQKTSLNQAPLFDIVDEDGISYGDKSVYDGSTFTGTKLFSYKVGSGTSDTVLGFPVTYKNISNIGDIVFNFNIATDSFVYKNNTILVTENTNKGYLVKTNNNGTTEYCNGWQTSLATNNQAAVRIYKNSNKLNNFDIDIYDDNTQLSDLVVKIYVNGIRLDKTLWSVSSGKHYKTVVLNSDITADDILTIRAFSKQAINSNGFYEVPINFQNNPLNSEIGDFTLGEINDHVLGIVDNLENFEGVFPGANNLRDLGNVTPYGVRFVQHSGPASLSAYHVTSDTNNIIRAMEYSRDNYNKFKRTFITTAENLGIETDTVRQVNLILQSINKDKPKNSPYYFSDMVPYSGGVKTELTVFDYRIKTYPLSSAFTLDELSSKSVLIYLNEEQLLFGKDYTFNNQGFVIILATLTDGDAITIYEFENTNGCFVPPTPTKLGLWPKYEPKKYLDTTLVNPVWMIQGHDGSLIKAFGDYRDDLIIELEKRIYNNIKISYDAEIFDVCDYIPSYNRPTDYSLKEFNLVLSTSFYGWASNLDRDFTKPISFNNLNSTTFNYKNFSTPDGITPLPGYWRGIYQWMLGTDRPNICPWEMLGFSEQPLWWEDVYGPAPYTSNNLILWDDLTNGLVREPGKPVTQKKQYVRQYLKGRIPVDENGNIVSPLLSGLAVGVVTNSITNDLVFGDVGPVEAAWRRSSLFPFSVILSLLILKPASVFGLLLDRSRVVRNKAGQLVYKDTNLRVTPSDIVLPSVYTSNTNTKTSGIINYIVDYILSDRLKSLSQYEFDLTNIEPRLTYRISGFTSKEKFKLLLDSKTPASSGSVFVPQEDYDIILNSSSPVKKINYSAVIVNKLEDGYAVKGYSKTQPYFKYYPYVKTGILINVGGISEGYTHWTQNQQYVSGKVVAYGNRYYRVKTLHTTSSTFNPAYYTLLPALPITGGRDAYLRQSWDRDTEIVVPYGTKFETIQEVVDFLLGYGEFLKDEGFVFDDFNSELGTVTNWETSAKEFMFWTTQNWSTGKDKWENWESDKAYSIGSIVKYNGDYYRAISTLAPSTTFNVNDYVILEGLSEVGSSVISLSPSATSLTFSTPLCVVDDIRNPFNGYEIFKVNGTPIQPNFLNNYRDDNSVSYTPVEDGIYGATFYLVQKEQVVILNNTTLFNDTIYNPESGYRQERVKVAGYVSSTWNGSFDIPGFIFDQASINDWQPWQDYALGDIVKHKQFYYSAKAFTPGTEKFVATDWIKLDKKPESQLLPNWTYKATQFQDFYSLDSDNFDPTQQQLAQHLVGYQKRQYLSNIIQDDVSEFKFYQGMIQEKGTQNVLNKLFDVLSADGQESIKFYEEWALRVGQYGANGAFENIEFVIDEAEFKNNPQGFELVTQIDSSKVDFIVRQTPTDVYLKPVGYNNNPWPTLAHNKEYLRTPGYVRSGDVKLVVKSFDEILDKKVSDFVEGDYVWVGFEGRSWNVYRFTRLDAKVTNMTYSAGKVQISLYENLDTDIGSYIGVDHTSEYNGFYTITGLGERTIQSETDLVKPPVQFSDQQRVTLWYFKSQRSSSIDYADDVLQYPLKDGELLWTDNNGSNKWAVWKNTPAYTVDEILNSAPTVGLSYGRGVVLNERGTLVAISTNAGEIISFDKASPNASWIQRQTITAPFISKAGLPADPITPPDLTGDIIAVSSDGRWLATGTPGSVGVSTKIKFHNGSPQWSLNVAYSIGDIVIKNNSAYQCVSNCTSTYNNDVFDPIRNSRSYTGLTATAASGAGTGATFNVTANRSNYSVTVVNGGSAYAVGDTLRIFGDVLGGTAPTNNITIKVVSVIGGSTTGAIATVSIIGNAKIFWKELPYIPVDSTGTNSYHANTEVPLPYGVITVYEKDSNNVYSLVDTILSPVPAEGEKFGSSLTFGENSLFVGAIGYNGSRGAVYKLSYKTVTIATKAYDAINSSGVSIALSSTSEVEVGMYLKGAGFTSGQYVSAVDTANSKITISAAPDSTPGNTIEFTVTRWNYDATSTLKESTALASSPGAEYGKVVSMSKDGNTLLVSAPSMTRTVSSKTINFGKVFVYKNYGTGYSLIQTISLDDEYFGSSVSVSDDGLFVAISSTYADVVEIDQGRVMIYKYDSSLGLYSWYQDLKDIRPERSQFFGTKISFMNDYSTIVVYSKGSDFTTNMMFDSGTTTFDNNGTKLVDNTVDSGRIDIYDMYGSRWIYSESLENLTAITDGYADGLAVGSNQIVVGAPYTVDQGVQAGKVYEYRKLSGKFGWSTLHLENDKVDITKVKRAFLYNKNTNKMVTYLDVVDSAQGKIPGIADQEIKYKTFYDPAIYSSGNSDVSVDDGMAWTTPYVGTLWWDLRTAKFLESHDTDLVYRNSTWNTIFPGASIDVYEWVETRYTPDEWNQLADTEEGIAAGISGLSLYDNTVYSVVRKYDNVAKSFRNTYYFWVKDKKTIPSNPVRKMSAIDVANLIKNPRGEGYKYLALTGSNSFSLVNVKPLLEDQNVILSIEYWTNGFSDKTVHSQWKIVNNNDKTTIPSSIESKWFDSLCGKDDAGRLVPDTSLPAKLRYGIESRPRQGMFINRFEALKQFIEIVNIKLADELIVENKDLTDLNLFEVEPTIITGLYDTTLDSDAELRFTNIGTYEKPEFTPIIEDGRIVGIDIVSKGRGYIVAPYFTISGAGTGAKVRAKLNSKGQIVGADIINSGYGYTANTFVSLRNYSVLVHSDSVANGNWSIYSYEPTSQVWSRVQSQAYDVRKYWKYVDWYATGYNQFTAIDFSISSFVELNTIDSIIGSVVKVRTTSLGTWVLLEKYASSNSIDWTQSYRIVGRESGTIQFLSDLYSFANTEYGFDNTLYDSSIFDNSASVELRIILNSLKDKVLTDTLKQTYLDLFFNSVRYVLSEQSYVDWIFKTSFVKAQHIVGELKQKVTYSNDNLENFEDYIDEVKPYRTKVREYVSTYNKVDTNQLSTTDFDLPPIYQDSTVLPIAVNVNNGIIQCNSDKILEYPWKHWYDNLGFQVTELTIVDSGNGYKAEPVVRIVSSTGTGATARAFYSNGKINRIVLLSNGSGYLSAPTVVVDGGLIAGGTPARVVATIGNGVVRSNLIKVKFDRTSQQYFITDLSVTESATGTGSRLQFPLTWAPDSRVGKSSVTVNGVEVLRASYKLTTVKSTSKGFTSYAGAITFDSAPANGSTIKVSYIKDWTVLNASDRIQHYYDPAVGELGKDLAQLMTGVDYGGVNVQGLNFDTISGWGSVPYYSDKWGSFDETFDDYIVTVAANTHSFTLPYVPENNTQMNVYYVGKSVDQKVGDGYTTVYNFNIDDVYPPAVTIAITRAFTIASGKNLLGTDVITVSSTTGIKVGDVLTITPDVNKTVGFNTVVTKIISSTEVKINQILFKSINAGTSAIFTRTLIDPTDCTINPNGTVVLEEPIPVGSVISIVAYTSPVRLDDPNYNSTGVAQTTLATKQSEFNSLVVTYNGLINQKTTTELQLVTLNNELAELYTELNALTIILDGLTPSDPLYTPTVSDINYLVNTAIPAKQLEITNANNSLATTNSSITTNIAAKTAKQAEVDSALAILNGLPPLANTTAIMQTVISDGIADNALDPTYKTFTIPGTFVVSEGDQFIWRKSTSDGSIVPQENDYDTALTGGTFLGTSLSSATGLSADDILVDGDGFVTATTSPATEEVVPGQVVDAVAIKVYDRPQTGSANIKVDSFVANGVQTDFTFSQTPNSPTAVIVKFTDGVINAQGKLESESEVKTIGVDYTLDYPTNTIKFITAPPVGKLVSISSFGFNGSNILDLDYFIANGTTTEFITKAPWLDDITYLVYVNGKPALPGTPAMFKTDSSYESTNRVGIAFSVAPVAGAVINYVIVSGAEQTFSITNSEKIQGTGLDTYNLTYIAGDSLPIETSMLVRVNQKYLNGPSNIYHTITGTKVNYQVDSTKFLPYSLGVDEIFVYAGGDLLQSGIDYIVDLSGITIKITQVTRKKYLNQSLVISVKQNQEYEYIPNTSSTSAKIKFNKSYNASDVIEVVTSYKHDILDIQRTSVNVSSNISLTPDTPEFYNFKEISGGTLKLDRAVLDDNYVWVIKNGVLLTPSADFKLNEDKISIKLAFYPAVTDEFTVITYGGAPLTSGISYMQFKDMLNRVHFKRLNADKRTKLVTSLKYTDKTIEVEDASNFDAPSVANNKPGIIEIRGERIEFFTLTPKVVGSVTTYLLGQLRRGTLGTGVSYVHRAGSYVQDIGPSETIPYVEEPIVEQIKSDGTNIVPLNFTPTKTDTTWSYSSGYTSSIPTGYGQSDDIEVFVGGYSSVPWSTGVVYEVNDVVEVGSYSYRCLANHVSGSAFNDVVNTISLNADGSYTVIAENVASNTVWTFFIGNIRLKKQPYKVHNVNNAPNSPEGDIQLDAEFAVNGTSSELRLTHPLAFGTRVTVVKRTGTDWDSETNIMNSNGKIARFLKAVPGIWYVNIGKYEDKAGIPSTFDNSNGKFDSGSITFDQG